MRNPNYPPWKNKDKKEDGETKSPTSRILGAALEKAIKENGSWKPGESTPNAEAVRTWESEGGRVVDNPEHTQEVVRAKSHKKGRRKKRSHTAEAPDTHE